MNSQELTDYFYREAVGVGATAQEELTTKLTIEYLLECGIPETEIKESVMPCYSYKNRVMKPQNLPNSLWLVGGTEKKNYRTGKKYMTYDNLVERDTFYYHRQLTIFSKEPRIQHGKVISCPYYREPICRFLEEDVAHYYADKAGVDYRHLLTEYSSHSLKKVLAAFKEIIPCMAPIDSLLYAIDYVMALSYEKFMANYFKFLDYSVEVQQAAEERVAEMTVRGLNRIIWRTEVIKGE